MIWFTTSESLRILGELIRLNTSTASGCHCIAAQQKDARVWRSVIELADHCFHAANALVDREAVLSGSDRGWDDLPDAADVAVTSPAGPGVLASEPREAVRDLCRLCDRQLGAYDQAIAEPLDRATRRLLVEQRSRLEHAMQALAATCDRRRRAYAA